ncbi:MAG: hypothetical protein COU27_01950 [Candidatus Levybacteria bacterium CG10_big_fil_rev_8_21_14_0_10_36_7]|nr:MAG: hypothetical protein COU27_01950 [Candidatus Levybacteria bacterium CG10_big_fil_rev_8_21_14_0_10_36_7]
MQIKSLGQDHPLNRDVAKSNLVWVSIVAILLAITVLFGARCVSSQNELGQARAELARRDFNKKVFNFSSLFVNEVLRAESEVDFDTRLKLENAVRDLGDQEILDQWNAFTNSQTAEESQEEVKSLLGLLMEKVVIGS